MKRRGLVIAAAVIMMLGVGALALVAFQPLVVPVDAAPSRAPSAAASLPADTPVLLSGPITLTLGEALAWPLPSGWQATTDTAELVGWPGSEGGEALMVAWEGTTSFKAAPVRLTIVATPRHGLSLARYAAIAARGLADRGFAVTQSAITTTLRADRLPVAELAFDAGDRRGHQVAAFDATGKQLWLMTLAAPEEQYEARLGEFRALIRQATFE